MVRISVKQLSPPELELLAVVNTMPIADLPRLLGRLREAEAVAMARLYAAVPTSNQSQSEQLLDVGDAARRLNCSPDFLYRHWKQLPFARKYDFGLRFSESGLNAYIRSGQR